MTTAGEMNHSEHRHMRHIALLLGWDFDGKTAHVIVPGKIAHRVDNPEPTNTIAGVFRDATIAATAADKIVPSAELGPYVAEGVRADHLEQARLHGELKKAKEEIRALNRQYDELLMHIHDERKARAAIDVAMNR